MGILRPRREARGRGGRAPACMASLLLLSTTLAAGGYIVSLTVADGQGGRASASVVATPLSLPTIEVEMFASPSVVDITTVVVIYLTARSGGEPLPGANVVLNSTPAVRLSPASGTTNATGVFTAALWPDVPECTDITIDARVAKEGYASGSGSTVVSVVSRQPPYLSLTSNRREMMSYEIATIRASFIYCDAGVEGATVTASSSVGGTFGPVSELGNGTYVFNWTAPLVARQTFAPVNVLADGPGSVDASARVTILLDPNKTNPANPTQLFLLLRVNASYVNPGRSITITVYAYTIEGYVVSGATLTVLLVGPGSVSTVTDQLNGMYTFVYTAPSSISGAIGILITVTASKYGYASARAILGTMVVP